MSDQDAPASETEPELPAYIIEAARSGRSKCKSCRKAILKDALRLGVMVEGPFGAGHMWYHLTCSAKRLFEKLEEAYQCEAWNFAKIVPTDLPPLEELSKLKEEADLKKVEKKELPYCEPAPSGRARCKQCDELIEKGATRVVVGREVEFGQQTRTTPINVHPGCVADALHAEDSATEPDGFAQALRDNSKGQESAMIDSTIEEVGSLF
ncbi:MAG: hypothetical protein ACI8X5_002405 [Planctomycetota bacterium]|jgi:hypothetical protein